MAEFRTSIDIEAPPDIVFAQLVTTEGMLAWMGQQAELDPTPGGTFSVGVGDNPIRGEYLEVDPPRSVVISWGLLGSERLPAGSTRVEFRLHPIATGTRLDLTHIDLPDEERPRHDAGWTNLLAGVAPAVTGRLAELRRGRI